MTSTKVRGKSKGQKQKISNPIEDKLEKSSSLFEKRLVGIRKAIDKHDYGEQAVLKMYKGLLDTVLSLIPLAENNYKVQGAERSAYILSTLINQAREITNDMRAISSLEGQALKVIELMRRQITLIAQSMVDSSYNLKKALPVELKPARRRKIESQIDAMVASQAQYLNESVKGLSESILSFMTERTPTKTVGKPDKGKP